MINGNFSPSELAKLGTKTASGGPPGTVPTSWPGGQMPVSLIDPSMQALMKLYPAPNADPNATAGYNYVQSEIFNQNNYQWTVRGDYNVSDNTKVFVRYNMQREQQQFPVGLWWRNTDQVPYPTPIEGKNRSDSVTGTLTHVFSPTMTNETVFAYTFVGFPNVFQDPSKVRSQKVGYNDPTLFPHTATPVPQIPSFGGSGVERGGVDLQSRRFRSGRGVGRALCQQVHAERKRYLDEGLGHTHRESGVLSTNGFATLSRPITTPMAACSSFRLTNPTFTYGDAYADMLAGNLSSYTEQNFNRINEISYETYEGFIQDSWKVTSKLTAELGLRMTHFTPWSDDEGYGYSIFNPSQYSRGKRRSVRAGPHVLRLQLA